MGVPRKTTLMIPHSSSFTGIYLAPSLLFQTPSRMRHLTSLSSASWWDCFSTSLVVMAFEVTVWAKNRTYSSATFLIFSSFSSSHFLLFSTLAAAQSRKGTCYVLATWLVFNFVIKNLHKHYPAFNAGG